jgi:ligand-binding sensor domain-containing protein
MPSNNAYGIIQDAQGFIWISTDRGLARYDGTRFVNYDVTNGLADNQIINLFYDSKGRIWINSLNGKLSYLFKNKVYSELNDKRLQNNFGNTKAIGSITEDGKGHIHFNIISDSFEYEFDGQTVAKNNLLKKYNIKDVHAYSTVSKGNGVYRFNNFNLHGPNNYVQPLNRKVNKSTQGANINTIAQKNNVIVYLDSTGVSELKPEENIIQLFKYPSNIKANNIKTIYHTGNNIWLGLNSGGLLRYAKENNTWLYKGLIFKNIDANNVFEDKAGNFWLSTNFNGIYYLPKFYEQVVSLNEINNKQLPECYSLKFYNNELWVGAANYEMLKIEDKQIRQRFTINNSNLGSSQAYKLLVNDKYLYAGFLSGIAQINKANSGIQKEVLAASISNPKVTLPGISLKSFTFNNKGKLIISGGVRDYFETDNPVLIKLHKPCFPGGRSYFAYTDPLGNSFISTNKGLTKIQDSNYIFLNEKDIVLKEKINTMAFVKEGMYIIGNNNGLHLIKNNTTIQSISDKKVLPGINCKRSIAKNGQIWIMCDVGVVEVKVVNDRLLVSNKFDLQNGLLNEPPVDFEIDSTNVYVLTGSDILAINKNLVNTNAASNTVITEFIGNNISKTFLENPVINEADLPLKISFDLLAYGISENKEFQYRLAKTDAWQTVSSNSVSLSELYDGEINFEVRGRIGNEDWGNITSLRFEYNKPFYKLRWVQMSALFLTMLSLFFVWQRRQKNKEALLKEKYEMGNKIAELKNQAMQNLMHPHFVFNSLNSIQHYINSNDKENANKYLTRFAKLIRLNLNSGINGFITVEDEIERLQLYLNLEALRFENEISFSIKVSDDLEIEDLYLPSMILQPFVENALWHGILPSGQKGHINISFSPTNEQSLLITIEDNGIGIENSKKAKSNSTHKSKGLGLIKDRMNLLQEKFKKTFSIDNSVPFPNNTKQPGNSIALTMPFLYEDDIK